MTKKLKRLNRIFFPNQAEKNIYPLYRELFRTIASLIFILFSLPVFTVLHRRQQ